VVVNLGDIDWQCTPDNLPLASQGSTRAIGGPRSSELDPAVICHGQPGLYKHMEVRIVHGALKGNFGTVVGTHWTQKSKDNVDGSTDEYEEVADVETETQAVKSHRTYRL